VEAEQELDQELVQHMSPEDPELAADAECAGDVEQFIGDPIDDDLDVAIDAMLAEDEDDLDGDGLPDPEDGE
jgi:hypothetical protein